uniref:Integrase catalytic domain-containing protein n=1 Tax=Moniliophthora roreri TaxID=221103 RepID=A0A0W0EXY6_MONRR
MSFDPTSTSNDSEAIVNLHCLNFPLVAQKMTETHIDSSPHPEPTAIVTAFPHIEAVASTAAQSVSPNANSTSTPAPAAPNIGTATSTPSTRAVVLAGILRQETFSKEYFAMEKQALAEQAGHRKGSGTGDDALSPTLHHHVPEDRGKRSSWRDVKIIQGVSEGETTEAQSHNPRRVSACIMNKPISTSISGTAPLSHSKLTSSAKLAFTRSTRHSSQVASGTVNATASLEEDVTMQDAHDTDNSSDTVIIAAVKITIKTTVKTAVETTVKTTYVTSSNITNNNAIAIHSTNTSTANPNWTTDHHPPWVVKAQECLDCCDSLMELAAWMLINHSWYNLEKTFKFKSERSDHLPTKFQPKAVSQGSVEALWTLCEHDFRQRELYCLLGIKLAAFTVYHPQTDGQTEQVNQELEEYLCLFVSHHQDDWDELLPLAEFSYNNHIHSSTQQTPFMLDTGCNP